MAEEKTPHNAGWYVGVAAFWLTAAWLVVAGLSSIIPQIFSGAAEATQSATECAEQLSEEKTALLARLSAGLSAPGESRESLDGFLRDWDVRVHGLGERCPARTAQAADELLRVRHALRDTLTKLDREQGPRLRNFTALLEAP